MRRERIARIIRSNRAMLRAEVPADAYLSSAAARFSSHRFLGRSTQGVFERQVAFLARLLAETTDRPTAELRVLDWGCGKGHISYLLRRHGFSPASCDLDDGTDDSSFGQDTPIITEQHIEVVPLRDEVQLPFDDASFDCVTSFGVLEHVSQDRSSMREIHRVLKPGGMLFITFLPYALSWTQAAARLRGNTYHDRLYWRRTLTAMAADTGFEVAGLWLAQLFPKNSVPLALDRALEPLDRFLCWHTPLRFFATNIEAVLISAADERAS